VDVPLLLYSLLKPQISLDQCVRLNYVISWGVTFGIMMAGGILALQTYALWACSKQIKIFLVVQYTVVIALVIIINTTSLRSYRYGPPLPMMVTVGCYRIVESKIVSGDFVLVMVQEAVYMALVLWIGMKTIVTHAAFYSPIFIETGYHTLSVYS